MKENNILTTHHPSSLNIHTVNNARFHIQAQWGVVLEYTLCSNRVGWGSLLSVRPGIDCGVEFEGFVAWLKVHSSCCTPTQPHKLFTNLLFCVPKLGWTWEDYLMWLIQQNGICKDADAHSTLLPIVLHKITIQRWDHLLDLMFVFPNFPILSWVLRSFLDHVL